MEHSLKEPKCVVKITGQFSDREDSCERPLKLEQQLGGNDGTGLAELLLYDADTRWMRVNIGSMITHFNKVMYCNSILYIILYTV